ncbi:APC family permease [Pantoea sp. A4]|uniref:APC family permease n=1 Tax=Pantoea sp. A4 TaxID=1225184 RepID=UPI0006870DC7|nr:APC family permease [Pantoea sp. A4]
MAILFRGDETSGNQATHFKKELSTFDLTFIGLGTVFGSGWLFSASYVASYAGPAGILSWIFAAVAVLALGLVYCELGAALPRSGGAISYLMTSHGPLMSYLIGLITVIYMSSMIAIEVVAARQYAAAWFPSLNHFGSSTPTMMGWLLQFVMLCFFFSLNYRSIKTFSTFNNLISILKFAIPVLLIIVLFTFFKPENFTSHGFAPMGFTGVEMAVSAGGVIFAFLGLTPIVSVASEVKNPQKTIPIALILSIVISGILYILLQVVFLGAVPVAFLGNGWAGVAAHFKLPFHDIAIYLGVGWLAILIVMDAIVSPTGCGNIHMNATPRIVYAWSRSGTFFRIFSKVDEESGIPRPALWLTFALAVFWTLPFPSWEAMISVVSASLVLSYAIAPVCVAALRRNAPELKRPFYLRSFAIVGPVSFVIATLIVYWCGWNNLSWLFVSQIVLYIAYLCFSKVVPQDYVSLGQQIKSSLWLIGYYILLTAISYLGSFGGKNIIPHPYDLYVVAAIAIVCYYWGAFTGIPKGKIDLYVSE